jgi:hypothetical protein
MAHSPLTSLCSLAGKQRQFLRKLVGVQRMRAVSPRTTCHAATGAEGGLMVTLRARAVEAFGGAACFSPARTRDSPCSAHRALQAQLGMREVRASGVGRIERCLHARTQLERTRAA